MKVNHNYTAQMHVDGSNIGPSLIIGLGEYTGGELFTADQGVMICDLSSVICHTVQYKYLRIYLRIFLRLYYGVISLIYERCGRAVLEW
jgi:hypothetical protein